jgi:drug/metabolite transporter (DMT)-like permease
MNNKGINKDNIKDFAILALANSFSVIFLQLFVHSQQIIYLILSISSIFTYFYFNYKMILNEYDVILVSAVGKITPIFVILILNILFFERHLNLLNLILGALLMLAGLYLIDT